MPGPGHLALPPIGPAQVVLVVLVALSAVALRGRTGAAGWTCLAIIAARVLAVATSGLWAAAPTRPGLFAAIDLATLLALLWVALRSRRHYPLVLAASGLIAVTAHGLALGGLIRSPSALDALLAATTTTMLLALVLRGHRSSRDPAPVGDNFPAGSACPGPLNR